MDELGSILREAREAKGHTLAEVQARTRINRKFLEALENAQYELLPTPVHVRGYLRNYARFLNLDPKPLLERYELSRGHRPPPVATNGAGSISENTPLPSRDDQPFFNPVNMQVGDERRDPGSFQRLVIIIALLVTIALIANRFIPILRGEGDGTEALTSGINEAVNDIVNGGDQDEADVELEGTVVPGAGEPITSTARNDSIVLELPTPTATRPRLPATLDTIQIRLDITERSWLQVTVDGEVVYEGLARPNDLFEWEAQQEVVVLTGNAIGIFVTINDIQLGKLGGRGEVVEETWSVTDNS